MQIFLMILLRFQLFAFELCKHNSSQKFRLLFTKIRTIIAQNIFKFNGNLQQQQQKNKFIKIFNLGNRRTNNLSAMLLMMNERT